MREGEQKPFEMDEPSIWITMALLCGLALMGLGIIYAAKLVAVALGWA